MTEQNGAEPDRVPEACTLPAAEQPVRLSEFDALFAAAVRDGERVAPQHLRITLPGGAEVAGGVRDLAERETRCCAFFTFTVSRPAETVVRLDIEVPADHVGELDALESRAASVRSRP